ncbi:MAG TPA: cupin domain-containing protein [Anaerolineales bacterium]|nr:cupin domain-containing protein [Anaerolineales bacterium]
MQATVYPNWKDKVVFSAEGPQPQVLAETGKFRVVLVGLEPGQKLPPHPASQGVYHFLEGTGAMIVDGERVPVAPGVIVVVPDGAKRGVEAETRLAFLAARAE